MAEPMAEVEALEAALGRLRMELEAVTEAVRQVALVVVHQRVEIDETARRLTEMRRTREVNRDT